MSRHHRNVTQRIARMLRELEGTDTTQNDAVDVAKSVTDRGAELLDRTAQQWFRPDVAGVMPLLRGRRVRSI